MEEDGLGVEAKTTDALGKFQDSYTDEKEAEHFQPVKSLDLVQRARWIAQLDPACDPRSGGLGGVDEFSKSMGYSTPRVRHLIANREDAGFIRQVGPDEKGRIHYYSCQNSCSHWGALIRAETKERRRQGTTGWRNQKYTDVSSGSASF